MLEIMDEIAIPIVIKVVLTIMVALPGIVAMYASAKSNSKNRELAFGIGCGCTAFSVIGAFYVLSLDILMGTAGLLACLGSISLAYWVVRKSNLLTDAEVTP